MKTTIVLFLAALSLSVNALPTYEPFTEFASQVAANPTNALDLATGGYTAPSGELWTALDYSGLATGSAQTAGLDVLITSNGTLYTANSVVFPGNIVSSLLPPGFPGAPTNLIQNGGFLANAALFTASPGYINYEGNVGNITDWTTSTANQGINGAAVNGGLNFSSGSPFGPANQAGYTYVFLQNSGSGNQDVSQNLPSLAPNTTYRLSFQAAARSGESGDTFQVQIGDANGVGDIFSSGTNAANNAAFINYSYTFTTPGSFSGTPSLQLQNVSTNSGVTVNFADVSLAPASAPTSIPIFVVNPAQPGAPSTTVGNSAVLNFAQDITRPASGTKTLYVSYMFSVAQQGQLGGGNDGRYLGFLAASNLVEPSATYPYWNKLFNTFGTTRYCGHGLLADVGNVSAYIGACDSSTGKDFSAGATPFTVGFTVPSFVVGAYTFTSGQGTKDTNSIWVNPPPGAFGGAAPPVSPTYNGVMAFNMSDLGGLVLIDRVGSGASGGVGTNYIANLLVGSTWSYVTGGPEFTAQPTNVIAALGGNVSFSGVATAAAQTVTYQWERIQNDSTNQVVDGQGGAGGSATVSGATTTNLVLSGIQAGDVGTYVLLATASGTGFSLASSTVQMLTDPSVLSQPQPFVANYGATVTFTISAVTEEPSLSYTWYDNGTPLSNGLQPDGSFAIGAQGTNAGGTTTITLTLTNVSYLDEGGYSVLVTNNVNNSATSASAHLTVNDPIIVTQPTASTTIATGSNTTLSVVAEGTGPLVYQWYSSTVGQLSEGQQSDGSGFSGVTTTNLSITNAQPGEQAAYYVSVTGPGGQTAQSSNANVYVLAVFSNPTNVGPFSPSNWPISAVSSSQVDYIIIDPDQTGFSVPSGWNPSLSIPANAGDQTWTSVTYGGLTGDEFTGQEFNVADSNWQMWEQVPVIDVLLEVYGNNGFPAGHVVKFTEGQLSDVDYVAGTDWPSGVTNDDWNWVLVTVTNEVGPDGNLLVGDATIPESAGGGFGGVNNGTLRVDLYSSGPPELTVRAVAFGPHGVFGSSNQVDQFVVPPVICPPMPTNNLAYIDFNKDVTNNLTVIDDSTNGETYIEQQGVGPANDPRTAIQSSSGLMNFGILNGYLGQPCNGTFTMQLCMEVYDDTNLAGYSFGPSQYATDAEGDLATYTGSPYTLTGSGQWLKVAFYLGPANLAGVGTAPLTGGPTVTFNGPSPFFDRIELGVIQTGTSNVLAGVTPDPNYYIQPLVTCGSNYGYYAEWFPADDITNNVSPAAGYGTALEGPADNQRLSEVPNPAGGGSYYEQFVLQNNVFGPVLQDNSDVIITMDYYDDPALVGDVLYPNVYSTLSDGNTVSATPPYNTAVLQGTGQWVTGLWEIPNVNFSGGSVCRFASSAAIYVSRVRYDLIRPCGPLEGIDYLQALTLTNASPQVQLNWRGTAALQGTPNLLGFWTNVVDVTNTLTNVYVAPTTNGAEFYRLAFPNYPTNLSTNIP